MVYATLLTRATEALGLTTFEALKNLPPGERQERDKKFEEAKESLVAECRTRLDQAGRENRNFSPTEQAEYDVLFTKLEELNKQHVEVEKRWATEMYHPIKPIPGGRPYGMEHCTTGEKWQDLNTGREYRAIGPKESLRNVKGTPGFDFPESLDLGRFLRGAVSGDWRHSQAELRALQITGQGSLGGFLLPQPVSDFIVDLARAKTVAIQAGVRTMPIDTGTLRVARLDEDPQAGWRPEGVDLPESNILVGAYNVATRVCGVLVKASEELIMDSVNAGQVIEQAISQSLALEIDKAVMLGDGVNKPLGLKNNPDVNVVDLGGVALSGYDNFTTARGKILQANGPKDGLSVVMPPAVDEKILKLKDGNGRPLQPPLAWQEMKRFATTSLATNESCLGDFSQGILFVQAPIRLDISRQSGEAFKGLQVWIRGWARLDFLMQKPAWATWIKNIG